MLNYVSDRQVVTRKVAFVTEADALGEMLGHLSVLWKYRLAEPGDPEALLLIEEGAGSPVPGQSFIRLTRDQSEEPGRLRFPLGVENLWQALESRFHETPRRHIRFDTDIAAHIVLEGYPCTIDLQSLSDMGCRFSFDRELVRQQELAIAFEAGGHAYRLDGRVIYSVPEWGEQNTHFRIGLLFHEIEKAERDRLRDDLVRSCLEDVRSKMEEKRFREALSYFSLPAVIEEKLGI